MPVTTASIRKPEVGIASRALAVIAAKAGDRAAALAMLRPADQFRRAGYIGGGLRCTGREQGRKVWVA